MEYNLSALDDREFETLCDDLIGQRLGVSVKRGKGGRDGGIDGSFLQGSEQGVVQAKHYGATGFSGLLSELKKSEVKRAERIGAPRYILMTSCGLSEGNRDDVLAVYHGLIVSREDIFSGDDICAELSKPENDWILQKHYKLWLSSVTALEEFCGDGNYTKSLAVLDEIKSDLKVAVRTEPYSRALLKLDTDGILIIGGQAGTGKTTLAKQLVQELVFSRHYQLVASDFDIGIFERQLGARRDQRLVFYLDDFLGANIMDVLRDNRDARIVSFIRRIRAAEGGRYKLIMTSRTNIIRDAENNSAKLSDARISEHVLTLSDDRLSRIDRASILYSHLYHGTVSEEYKGRVYENENYFKILDHRNFNPRIVSYCFAGHLVDPRYRSENDVMTYIREMLDHPERIWRDCFGSFNRFEIYVVSTVFLKGEIDADALIDVCGKMLSEDSFREFFATSIEDVLKKLCCSVLTRTVRMTRLGEAVEYSLFNPSVGDYILGAYADNHRMWTDVLRWLEDADVAIQTCRNISWLAKSNPPYSASCRIAFTNLLDGICSSADSFSCGFVLRLFNDCPTYIGDFSDRQADLARSIRASGLCFRADAPVDHVIRFLDWCRSHDDGLESDPRITKEYLDGLESRIDEAERYLEIKAVYEYYDFEFPEGLYSDFREKIDDWVFKLANEDCYSGDETEEDVRQSVYDKVQERLSDYDIPEGVVTADDCVSDFDFSPWASSDEDGSSWRDVSEDARIRRDIEDREIRRIFRRG